MKKSFITIICTFLFSFSLKGNVFVITNNSKNCMIFLKGVEKYVKFTDEINNANLILTCEVSDFNKIKVKNIPIFAALVNFCVNDKRVKIVLRRFPSIKKQMEIIDKITKKENIYGIILKDKNKISCLKNYHLKNLKIFAIKNNYEIPYIIDKAVKLCDIILLYPDKYLENPLILQFIIKKIVLSGKSYIGYSKKFLNLGAKAVFLLDYYSEGIRMGKTIKKYLNKKKILEPTYFKIKVNE